jgi:hypothetical protein
MEYWSDGVLQQVFGGEPLLTLSNPSHDLGEKRRATAGLFSRRLPGTTQSVVLPYKFFVSEVDRTVQWLSCTRRRSREPPD